MSVMVLAGFARRVATGAWCDGGGVIVPEFEVEFTQPMTARLRVEADSPEAAAERVSRYSYPLPPRSEWTAHKSGSIRVYGPDGKEQYEIEF